MYQVDDPREAPRHSRSTQNIVMSSQPSGPSLPTPPSSRTMNDATQSPPQPSNPRLMALEKKKADLTSKLADLTAQRAALVADMTNLSTLDDPSQSSSSFPSSNSEEQKTMLAVESASQIVKDHIKRLQRYNEIKDIGQGLMGMIAEKRGVRVGTVMEEYGMDAKD